MNSNKLARLAAFAALLLPIAVWAQTGGLPALTSTPGPGGSQTYTLSIQTLLTTLGSVITAVVSGIVQGIAGVAQPLFTAGTLALLF